MLNSPHPQRSASRSLPPSSFGSRLRDGALRLPLLAAMAALALIASGCRRDDAARTPTPKTAA